MMIYVLILIFIFVSSCINKNNLGKFDKIFFVFLAVILGFRYGVGTDFFGYVKYFNLINTGYSAPVEPGFIILSKAVSSIGLNSQAVFLSISILTIIFWFNGIKYYTKNEYIHKTSLYIILIIFTYLSAMNGVRQALAAAIIFFGSRYIVERKFFKFTLWTLFAMMFHFSSVVFLPIYFIAVKNYKKISLLTVIIVSFIVARSGIINYLLEYLLLNFRFMDIGGYIQNYLHSSYNMREVKYGVVFFINVIILLIFIMLKDRILKSNKSLLAFNFFYLYILSNILSIGTPALSRLTYYFSIYMALSISKFPVIFEKNSRKIGEYILLGLYSLLFLYIIANGFLNPDAVDFLPYNFKFDIVK